MYYESEAEKCAQIIKVCSLAQTRAAMSMDNAQKSCAKARLLHSCIFLSLTSYILPLTSQCQPISDFILSLRRFAALS